MLRRNGPVIKPWSQSWGRKGVYGGKDLWKTVADVCLAMQPGRADAGVHFRRPGLHVDRLELAPGADHAAL